MKFYFFAFYIYFWGGFIRKGIASIISAVTVVSLIVTTVYASVNKIEYEKNEAEKLPLIIIDPGHGGFDGGCVAADGTCEKDVNLFVSLVLAELFENFGCKTLLVRSTDTSVETEGSSVRERKKSDIKYRFSLMKKHKGCIYLSIHQNNYSSPNVKGAQMFYTPNNPNSESLAECIQNNIANKVQLYNKRKIKSCTKDVYIIHYAPIDSVAVLVECGFLSNKSELSNLKNSDYVNRLCFSIACGVFEWAVLKEDYNG